MHLLLEKIYDMKINNLSEIKNLLIIIAMDVEEDALLKNVQFREKSYGRRVQIKTKQFDVNHCSVTIANSGVGSVNAALVLNHLFEYISLDAVLVLGVGGALCPDLDIGDTVIANKIIQHDSITSTESGKRLIAAGELTLSVPENRQIDPVIYCDPFLINWLQQSFKEGNNTGNVKTGTILSGSEFVANPERKKELTFLCPDAFLVEMEAAGIAQIARKLKIPFVVAKTVSDRAVPNTSISKDYRSFLKSAANHSSLVLQSLLNSTAVNVEM